jgi:hypothetical protein
MRDFSSLEKEDSPSSQTSLFYLTETTLEGRVIMAPPFYLGISIVHESAISISFPIIEKVSISISFIESGHVISTLNGQSVRQPLAEV